MKKVLLILFSMLITFFAFAQDIIITKEGKKIESIVFEISDIEIKYKIFGCFAKNRV
jgi:plasmid replication initiation protein